MKGAKIVNQQSVFQPESPQIFKGPSNLPHSVLSNDMIKAIPPTERTSKLRTNSGIRNINLVSDYGPSFSLGLTQKDVVKIISNPLQSKKSERSKEIRSKFRNDPKRKAKEIEELSKEDDNVQNYFAGDSEKDSEEEVMRNEIFIVRKLPRFALHMCSYSDNDIDGSKDVIKDEHSVDSDDEFRDPPPKHINERSKKKQKVDSSTPDVKKPSRKKPVNIVDDHNQKRTSAPRAAKATVQSKSESPVDVEIVSKLDSPVEKEAFISKNIFDAFRDEQQYEDIDSELQHMNYAGAETSPQRFNPNVDQNLDKNEDGTKFIISDELLPSLNAYRRDSITTPLLATREEPTDEYLNDKKLHSVVEDYYQTNKDNVGLSSKSELHVEVDLVMEEKITTPLKIQDLTTDEQRDESVWPNSQNAIPDELVPNLNIDSSISIIVHSSANLELQTPVQNLRIRRSSKFKESPYMIKFGSATVCSFIGSSARHIHIFPQKHPFVYHPIDGIVDTKIVKKFMDWISVNLLKVHAKRSYKFSTVDCNFMNIIRSVHDVSSVGHQNLNAGGREAHLNEYINGFCMHAAMPWHIVEDIYIPVNINEKHHWVLAVLSFSERCIFLYDSYESSGHYPTVFTEIEKLVEIIPLCLQACDFYDKKGIDLQNHPRYKDKDSSDMFDVLFEEKLPQQPSASLFRCSVPGSTVILRAHCSTSSVVVSPHVPRT
ncbi:hypothetical protein T459_31858 [Capsicum annuum]|uniref:Ubiquitin-like protease family profile domain-containing protein n=1 Tax=Capsicum annuum TaxID=4072 RepID=A0A2G2Y433_CAPAN|nr:hypothetical protein T459_31858 [Capsicum annuum]